MIESCHRKRPKFRSTRRRVSWSPHFLYFYKKGEGPLLETVLWCLVVPRWRWKIVGLPLLYFRDWTLHPTRLLLITQLLNYETKRVINHNKITADQGSALATCSNPAYQEQILSTRVVSKSLKPTTRNTYSIKMPIKKGPKSRSYWHNVVDFADLIFSRSMHDNCLILHSIKLAL